MEGYLPIPQQTVQEGPLEVILRFSTGPQTPQSPDLEVQTQSNQSPGQVFLHAVGATATFGKSFSQTQSQSPHFTIHSGPTALHYHSETDGCEPFTLPHPPGIDGDNDVVVMLDRGGCPFLDKLVHASRAGAKGLLVAGLSPSESKIMGMLDPDGLVRPSADDESPDLLQEVKGVGLVYVDWKTGDVLRRIFSEDTSSRTPGTSVMVEVMSLDGQSDPDPTAMSTDSKTSSSSSSGRLREGRVGVGEHVIRNLRIVEVPP